MKSGTECVTDNLDHIAVISFDCLAQKSMMVCKLQWNLGRVLLPKLGAAFDIGEQKCNYHAGWESR